MGKVVSPFYLGLVVVVMATFVARDLVVGVTLEDKMKDDPDLSQYYELIESSKLARVILQLKPVTIFAPINSAFQKFNLNNAADKEAVLLYHITSIVQTIQQFGSSNIYLSSESIGNSPIWITHVINTTQDDIYVNNARLLIDQSNIVVNNENLRQVLHKIDEVLMPTISPSPAPTVIYNPTAWEFLENFESFMNGLNHRVRIFRQKVQANNKQDIFNLLGSHTFFIPVDEGFNDNKMRLIDSKVIDGHVIPKHVLFTRPTKKDFPFETLASTDNMKVVVSFNEEQEGPARKTEYVKSHTLFGTGTHAPGVVLAEIVKANIPVKNGVIHLIQKPLMVVDSNVKQLLEEKNGHILSRFFEVLKDQGQRGEALLKILETTQEITLLAPSNNALQGDRTLDTIMNNKQHFFDILKMHIVVDDRLYVEKILREQRNSKNGVFFRAPSYNPGKPLYFNVLATEHNRSLTIEGGGVNASVIQADLAATNGIIHIIDRVLGVPHATVLEKIQSDPLLQITYSLGNIRGFNEQLSDVTKRFTYFVPSDRAWKNSKIDIQKLYHKEYTNQATATLERHLVISDEEYTMERIKQLSEDTHTYGTFGQKREVEMLTRTEPLKLYVEQMPDNTFNLIWKGQRIPVLRANVECINGIIHIIDVPFVQEGDIPIYNVNSVSVISLAPQLITLLLVKYLLL